MPLSRIIIEKRLTAGLARSSLHGAPNRQESPASTDLSALWAVPSDSEFIRRAYRAILGRECDPEGMETYTRLLYLLSSREEIASALMESEEARSRPRMFTGLRPVPAPASGLAGLAQMVRRAGRRIMWSLHRAAGNGAIN
jgi:hypothetical protein